MRAIIIVANGWHAGWLGCYGNEWLRTHNLDRLAAESVVFDQHFTVDPSPTEWYRSIATSRYSSVGQTFLSAGRQECLPHSSRAAGIRDDASLLLALKNSGVRTVRLHDLKCNSAARQPADWSESIAVPKLSDATPGEAMFLQLDQTLQELAGVESWLLWIETDRFVPPWDVSLDFFDEYAPDMAFLNEGEEPHPWDEPPIAPQLVNDRDFERLQTTFASVVTEWDVELAEWFELFREHHLDETALWAVTAGYGLSLGEHGWIGPAGDRPFEELGHVPLIVRLPNAEQAGRRVPFLSANLDLLPTLFDAFGKPLPGWIHGRSLLPSTRGSREPIRTFVRQRLAESAALRTDDWALLTASEQPSRLFRKPEDRWEVNDARQQHLEWAEHLEAVLQAHIANPDAPPSLKSYDEIVKHESETEDDDHGDRASGKRDDRSAESEGGLRGHQSDKED